MIYVGMDISSKEFMIYAMNDKKKVLMKGAINPSREGLRTLIKELGSSRKLVVYEAGNQMRWISDTLKKMKDVDIHVVHPNEVKWITQSRKKTDKVDARKLAELARGDHLPRKVHVVEGEVRELRDLLSARDQLVSKRVSLMNTIRGLVKQEGHKLPVKFFARLDWESILMSLTVADHVRVIVANLMKAINELIEIEKTLYKEIITIEDGRTELLESIPCIGKLSSRVIVSGIDNARRFDNKKCVARYGGLAPTIYQSGDVTNMGHINRDGRTDMRKALIQCAHTITRIKTPESKPLRDFFEKISKKRGKKIAIVALARKLLTVAYGVLKNGEFYNPGSLTPNAA